MLIDMIEAKKAFKEYVKKYNPEDEKIKIKIVHIEKVAENSKRSYGICYFPKIC